MEYYKTTDIVLAATLKVKGYTLSGITKKEHIGIFAFDSVDDQFLSDYSLGSVLVEPIAFNGMIRQLTSSVKRTK